MAALAKLALSSEEEGGWLHDRMVALDPAMRGELLEIVRRRSFRTGTFTLSSGEVSNLYFNMKRTMMNARGAELAARAFLALVRVLDVDYVTGLEMGAVPVIGSLAALSSAEGRPVETIFVRKLAKEHGTQEIIEGLTPDECLVGKRVLVIDDVSTTGKSILQAINEIRAEGGIVEHAACLVNRVEGGDELLAKEGVFLHSILHVNEFVQA